MKKFAILFLVTVILFSITACGKQAKKDAVSNSKSVSESVTKSVSIEELNESISKDVTDTITALNSEFKKLSADINTYNKYKSNTETVNEFYIKIQNDINLLCMRLREYSVTYAEMIISSDKSFDDKYDDFDELYDNIYEDAREKIYDEVYDDIFDDLYDTFYDGILKDAYDNVPYEEWSGVHSDEYEMWSDTHSEIYDIWSDTGSDIYDFWSDMRSEMLDKNMEKAKEKIQKFKNDIDSLYEKSSEETTNNTAAVAESTRLTQPEQKSADKKQWQQFLEDYESWINNYIQTVKKYSDNPADASILTDYTKMISELAQWQTKAENIKTELENAAPEELMEFSAELLKLAAKIAEAAN